MAVAGGGRRGGRGAQRWSPQQTGRFLFFAQEKTREHPAQDAEQAHASEHERGCDQASAVVTG